AAHTEAIDDRELPISRRSARQILGVTELETGGSGGLEEDERVLVEVVAVVDVHVGADGGCLLADHDDAVLPLGVLRRGDHRWVPLGGPRRRGPASRRLAAW